MEHKRNPGLVWGIILIAMGVFFFVAQAYPGLAEQFFSEHGWPLLIVGLGGIFLILGLLTNTPGLFVPACIIGGLGALLYWQNYTGRWESWAYTWALLPGFSGMGIILMGIWTRRGRIIRSGLWTLTTSLILFALFASAFSNITLLERYWPLLIIALGFMLLIQSVFGRRRHEE